MNRLFSVILFVLIFSGCTNEYLQMVKEAAREYVSASELKNLLDSKAHLTIIDLRSAPDFNNSHIPTAINVPYFNVDKYNGDKGATIILYFQSESTQKQVMQKLKDKGYKNIRLLSGGYQTWEYEVEKM